MIKKKYIVPLTLIAFVMIFIFIIYNAGNKHSFVITRNLTLHRENKQLKIQNDSLVTENKELVLKSKIITQPTNDLARYITEIEVESYQKIGWITPGLSRDLLEQKLNRIPTKKEINLLMERLIERDLLYYSDNIDPYVKGVKITKEDLQTSVLQFNR